jgi:hypothetical protein
MSPVRPRSPAPKKVMPAIHFSYNSAGQQHEAHPRRGTQVVRERSAKPLCVGSIPTRASKFYSFRINSNSTSLKDLCQSLSGHSPEEARRKSDEHSNCPVSPIPSITIFVRHRATASAPTMNGTRGCRCFKHLRWSHGGQQYRQAAKTRTWSVAEERRHEIEARLRAADPTRSRRLISTMRSG